MLQCITYNRLDLSLGADNNKHSCFGMGHLWYIAWVCVQSHGCRELMSCLVDECCQEYLRDITCLIFKQLLIIVNSGLYRCYMFHNFTSRKVMTGSSRSWKLWYGCCSCQKAMSSHIWLHTRSRSITYYNYINGIHQPQSYSYQWVLVIWMVIQIFGVPKVGYAVL